MTRQRALVTLGIVAGIAFIAIAIMYWTVPPKSLPLPNFLGHEAGVSAVHVKHGVASFLVGLACFRLRLVPKRPEAQAGELTADQTESRIHWTTGSSPHPKASRLEDAHMLEGLTPSQQTLIALGIGVVVAFAVIIWHF